MSLPVPIVFAPLLGFALGAALAWVARPELTRRDGPIVASECFALVLAFVAFVWLPVVGYFVAFHGDWSYLYLVAWRHVPSAVDLSLVLLAGGAVVASFLLAARPVRKRRVGPVLGMILIPGTVSIVGLILAIRRLAVSGTYAQFHGDFGTEPIAASPLGKGVLVMGVVVALSLAWTVRWLVRIAAEES